MDFLKTSEILDEMERCAKYRMKNGDSNHLYAVIMPRHPENITFYISDIEKGMETRGFSCRFNKFLDNVFVFELTTIQKPMKQIGCYEYITKFGTSDFEGAINALSESLEKTVSKHGPAHDLEWIIKEYPPMTPIEDDEDGKVVIFSKKTAWTIGWKALFEEENG